MNFFKALFGGKETTPEEKKKEEEAKNFDVLKYDGVRALQSGQADYAVKCFCHALDIHEDLEVRDYLSQAYIRKNELLLAYEQLQKLAEAQPDNQQIFIRMANVAYMMEDYNAMANACEKAMLINKEEPITLFLYAKACIGQEDMVNAIAMLTKAITLDANYGDAYLLRGETLLKMGDVSGADEDATHLIEHVGNHEDVLILKARVERKKGNADEAIAYYGKVIEENPFCIDAYRERGAMRLESGDQKGAAEDMQKVLELDPDKASGISGEFSSENVEEKVKEAYNSINPFGI